MNSTILWRVASLVTMSLAFGSQGLAQTGAQARLDGLIDDFTPALDSSGPWHVLGEWSLVAQGESGRADFSTSLSMVRSDSPAARAPHTHHVRLIGGDVRPIPNGYRISGTAVITSNGSLAGFSGSHVAVEITGGSAVPFANVTVTFGGAAAGHFGEPPLDGVVTHRP